MCGGNRFCSITVQDSGIVLTLMRLVSLRHIFLLTGFLLLIVVPDSSLGAVKKGGYKPDFYSVVESSRDQWGTSIAYLKDYYSQLEDAFYANGGLDIRFQFVDTPEKALAAFKSGQVQVGQMETTTYFQGLDMGLKLTPLRVFAPGGQAAAKVCVFGIPSKGAPLKVAGLKGKRIVFKLSRDYVLLRQWMSKSGITSSGAAFFGKAIKLQDDRSMLYALNAGQAHGAVMTWSAFNLVKKSGAGNFPLVKELFCLGSFPTVMVVYNQQGAPYAKRFAALLDRLHFDPAFSSVQFIFKATGGKWVSPPPGFFNSYRTLFQRAKSQGWFREYQIILANQKRGRP